MAILCTNQDSLDVSVEVVEVGALCLDLLQLSHEVEGSEVVAESFGLGRVLEDVRVNVWLDRLDDVVERLLEVLVSELDRPQAANYLRGGVQNAGTVSQGLSPTASADAQQSTKSVINDLNILCVFVCVKKKIFFIFYFLCVKLKNI